MNRQLRLVISASGELSIREVLFNEFGDAMGCSSEPIKMSASSKVELWHKLALAMDLATNSTPIDESIF